MTLNSPEIISLGCRLNIAESEMIRDLIRGSNAVVVNSCAVTQSALRQTRQAIRRARRDNPEARLIVTGCAAELDPDTFLALDEVDELVGNRDKLNPDIWRELVGAAPAAASPAPAPADTTGFSDHSRAFVPVQNGCDHRCTFCTIPFARGDSRSEPAGAVVARIAALVAAGHREVVLTGVDLTSYGPDLPGTPTLGMLVARILKLVPELERLRLSSLDSIEIDPLLLDLITGEPRVQPHVHLSLQAGDDMILKRMKRRHARADAVRLVERIKHARPEIAVGADLIAGFPTEDAAMFANTLALIDDCDIVHPHIFPYSPRPGTPAARMPQVPGAVIKARAATLREAGARRRSAWLHEQPGSVQRVLVERPGDRGHAGNFATVRLREGERPVGAVVDVRIDGVEDGMLMGVAAE